MNLMLVLWRWIEINIFAHGLGNQFSSKKRVLILQNCQSRFHYSHSNFLYMMFIFVLSGISLSGAFANVFYVSGHG